ncbi:MAG: GNAT family N-acetyltransferase [Bdellovibrionales bacterium]
MEHENLSVGLLEISDTITPEVDDALLRGLTANALAQNAPPYKKTELSIVRRDEAGAVVAGLTGKTVWGWLYTDSLWVDESLRGQGVGSALIKAAEEEALKRGCHSAYVWTESFEARGFYPKCGYTEYAVMDDFPMGHQKIGLRKGLA